MNPITMIDRFLINAAAGFSNIQVADNSVTSIIQEATDAGADKANEINAKVDVLGGSAISIVTRVGMLVAVIAMIGCGIGLIVSNSQKREEHKEKFIWGLVGSFIIFAATGIINIVQATANGMFGN